MKALKEGLESARQKAALLEESARQKAAQLEESARQKAAQLEEGARLKASKLKEVALMHASAQGFLNREDEGGQSDRESIGEDGNENDRLVRGSPDTPSMRGIVGFGSRLGQSLETVKSFGAKGVNDLRSATSQSLDNAKMMGSKGVSDLRTATNQSLDTAKVAGAKATSSLKTATAAGSSACRSGVDLVRSTTAAAKDGSREALSAAAHLSGVSLVGGKEREGMCCRSLTYRQRLVGMVSCLLLGSLLSLFSLGSLAQLILGNPAPFAIKYTIGNMLSLGATSFLVGPRRQCADMLGQQRRAASLLYLGSMAGTMLSVFVLKLALLSLLFIILQFLALTWYVLSYIPYGRAAATRLIRRLVKAAGVQIPTAVDTSSSVDKGMEMRPAGEV